eukprot:TRINITY_DN55202_c0_g1_i1.p1 TRINITY_DN55202_c0_g1~~TRINITY_DN55202_c0_g1_i1.p1  ORF type:complete len:279 (+),score=78.18 TRINITY_DN55202_c0_g1_i1:83-919(+)
MSHDGENAAVRAGSIGHLSVRGGGTSAARGTRSRGTMSVGAKGAGAGYDLTQHPTLSRDICRDALALYDSCSPAPGKGLSVRQLRSLLKDMGIDLTENQVKDLVFRVRQTPSVTKRNALEAERRAAAARAGEDDQDSASSVGSVPPSEGPAPPGQRPSRATTLGRGPMSQLSGVTPATTVASASGDREEAAFLDRRSFLEVLTMTLADSQPERELAMAWRELDTDGDGVLSVADLAKALQGLGLQQRPEELTESLHQADFDNDGQVSFSDFCKAMDTN